MVTRRGQYYVKSYITGPQCLLLMLNLDHERIDEPYVTPIDTCPKYGLPDSAVVIDAVLAGADEANKEFDVNWYPLEIRYSYSGYDNKQCRLMHRGAYDIIKSLAIRGPDAINEVEA